MLWRKEADENETENFEGGTDGGKTESLGVGGAQEAQDGHDVDPAKYPTLAKTNLVVNSQYVSSLVCDIVNFPRAFSDEFKVEYESTQGKRRKIIIVPQVSTDTSFKK